MNLNNFAAYVAFGFLGTVVVAWVAHRFFSAEARWERRRRRSNTRVSSTANRPMVKFSVRTKEDRRK